MFADRVIANLAYWVTGTDIANLAYWVTGTEGSNPSLSAIESLSPQLVHWTSRIRPRSGPDSLCYGPREDHRPSRRMQFIARFSVGK